MSITENVVQSESWNGESGLLWVANADERDRVPSTSRSSTAMLRPTSSPRSRSIW